MIGYNNFDPLLPRAPDLLLVVPQFGHQLRRDVPPLELLVRRPVALARAAPALEEEGLGQPLLALQEDNFAPIIIVLAAVSLGNGPEEFSYYDKHFTMFQEILAQETSNSLALHSV